MKFLTAIIALLALANCGADGAPIRPTVNTGVMISPSGVNASTSVGVNLGGVNVGIGAGT